MKASITMLILFLSVCMFGTLACALFVMLGCNLALLVAGNALTFFSADYFLRGVFISFPFVCVLALILLILYIIRHPAQPTQRVLVFAGFCLFSWAVLLPLSTALKVLYEQNPLASPEEAELTPGYFRELNGNVYYYSRTFRYVLGSKDVYGEGLFIDLTGTRGKAGEVYPFATSVTVRGDNNFSDIIFMNAAKMPPVVSVPLALYKVLVESARASLLSGVIPWIAFASLGLALFSTVFLRNVNGWRFLNASMVCVAAILVLTVNALLYAHRVLSDVSLACGDLFFDLGYYLPDIFSGVARIREPLALFANLAFVLIFTVAGFVCKLIVSRRESVAVYAEDDDE